MSWRAILPYVPEPVRSALDRAMAARGGPLEELRLRAGRPVACQFADEERWLELRGWAAGPDRALVAEPTLVAIAVELLSQQSRYAFDDQLRAGYITLPGGHRAGLAGRAVLDGGRVRTVIQPSGVNYRLARAVCGAADGLLRAVAAGGTVRSTLIISPPRCGKTTVLRDLVRQLSDGVPAAGVGPRKVAVVDERSEIAGCVGGLPQLPVGLRTDVLDACPKGEGLLWVLRALSPEVVATDEIGRPEDGPAVAEALGAGVAVLATAHAAGLADVARRPVLRRLLAEGAFARIAVLSRRRGPGTLEGVYDAGGRPVRPTEAAGATERVAAAGGPRP